MYCKMYKNIQHVTFAIVIIIINIIIIIIIYALAARNR